VAVVGRLGAVPLAAVGLANGLFFTISTIGVGVMFGLDPLVAQALGAGEPQRARRLLWQGVWLAFMVGLILSVPVLLAPLVLVPFGIAPDVAAEATDYLHLRLIAMVPMMLFMGLRSYLQSVRVTSPLVVSAILANVLNLILDWVFVLGGAQVPFFGEWLAFIPSYGASGAAIATVGCTLLQVFVLALGIRKVKVAGFGAGDRRWVSADLRRAVRVGLPVGLQLGAEVGIFALAGFLAGRIGAEALASHQIALTLASLSFTVAVGIGSAGGVRVGLAIGAGDVEGTRRAGLTAFAAGGGFMAFSALLFLLAPTVVAGLVTDKPELMEAAVPLLAVAALFQLSDGLQGVGSGVLRGAGDTRFTFLANVAGHYLVGLPVALVLGVFGGLGVTGLWYGLAAGLTMVAAALLLRFIRISGRPIRPIEVESPRATEPVEASG